MHFECVGVTESERFIACQLSKSNWTAVVRVPCLVVIFRFVLGALNLYWNICHPCFMGLRNKFCLCCCMWAHCKPEFLLALLAESKGSLQPAKRHYEQSLKFCLCFLLTQENMQCGETRGRHGSHKIYLPFGLDYNNKMSESPHGTLIWSNCLQKNQSHAFFWKTRGKEEEKNPFIFILLASLIFFYFSLTFRK